jgi:hypothetical protein
MELTEMSGNAMNVRDLYNIGFHPVLEQSDFDAVKHGQNSGRSESRTGLYPVG